MKAKYKAKARKIRKHISVEIIYRQFSISHWMRSDLERFSKHLKKVFHVHIFLSSRLVKISFTTKDFQDTDKCAQIVSPLQTSAPEPLCEWLLLPYRFYVNS